MSLENLSLEALQGWMQATLIFPRETDAGEIGQILEDSPRLKAADRLAIYQRSYHLRLLRCLQEQFPALCHALGRELFNGFAREYLQQLPSESYTLCDLGRRFSTYLEDARPDREASAEKREGWIDFMVDLTRFEREVYVMFDAPGHEGKPFASEGTPDDRLRLQPCFQLHESRFPVAAYYHQVKNRQSPELPPRAHSWLALARTQFVVHTFPLSAVQFQFLQVLQNGATASEALESVARTSGRPVEEISRAWSGPEGLRKRWIEAGFFVEREAFTAGP
jgi:hypothetical protein